MRRIGSVLVAAGAIMATSATGVAITHVFLQCGNGGNSPSANFAWAESP
jgi:hypothetical protein